jgi:hypothetical protein
MTNNSAGGSLTAGYTDCDGVSQTITMTPLQVIYRCSRITPFYISGANSLDTENLGSCVSPATCKVVQLTQTFGSSTQISYNNCSGTTINYTLSNDEVYSDCMSSYPIIITNNATIVVLGDCV